MRACVQHACANDILHTFHAWLMCVLRLEAYTPFDFRTKLRLRHRKLIKASDSTEGQRHASVCSTCVIASTPFGLAHVCA